MSGRRPLPAVPQCAHSRAAEAHAEPAGPAAATTTLDQERFYDAVMFAADNLLAVSAPTLRPMAHAEGKGFDKAARITFEGPGLQGEFVLALESADQRKKRGALFDDWVRELANQLAGRVKSRLQGAGGVFDVSIPETITAFDGGGGQLTRALRYASADSFCEIQAHLARYESAADADAHATSEDASSDDASLALEEGEMILF